RCPAEDPLDVSGLAVGQAEGAMEGFSSVRHLINGSGRLAASNQACNICEMAQRKKRVVSDEHKAAMAEGRTQSRAIAAYLDALETNKPKRGRKRTADSIAKRLEAIDAQLDSANPIKRLSLIQERIDLLNEK